MTLRDLITFAWDTDRDAVVGAPGFLDEDRFDVSALVPSTVPRPVDTEAVRPMLRLLLQERFRLTTHEDEQPLEVYTLTRTRPDAKMKRGSDTDRGSCKSAPEAIPANSGLSAAISCTNTTMGQFTGGAERARAKLPRSSSCRRDRSVGGVGFHSPLDGPWRHQRTRQRRPAWRQSRGAGRDRQPHVFEAIDRQLGLKLGVQKHPMPVLVIDRVEQRPTEN